MIKALKKLKNNIRLKIILKYENQLYMANCNDRITDDLLIDEREIIILSHTIEKGLSHKNIKPLFGKDAVSTLLNCLIAYNKYNEKDSYVLELGTSIIKEYIEANKKVGVACDALPILPEELKQYANINVGAEIFKVDDLFADCSDKFDSFALSRKSVRLYDQCSLPINYEEIIDSIRIAQYSPSACNRQAVRVRIITDADQIKKISEIQKGSRGFGTNAGAMILVFSDLRYYRIHERRLPMFDAGLFAMSLVYSLFSKKIGTCILNGSFERCQMNELKRVVNIKSYEMLATIITLNKMNDCDEIKVAKSTRKELDRIIDAF